MSRTLCILVLVTVLFGLGQWLVGVHAHDGLSRPDTCAACRALQTPLDAASPPAQAPARLAPEGDLQPSLPAAFLPGPPVQDGRLLRAPPCA